MNSIISRFQSILFILFFLSLVITGCKKPGDTTVADGDSVNSDTMDDGFVRIFDGNSLDGWEGDTVYWSVRDGSLLGQVTPETLLKRNTFISWKGGTPGDFELKLEFRIAEGGNSGINYRSMPFEDLQYALRGYQADIDGKNNYTGQNYEERGRTTLAYRGEKAIIHSQENPADAQSFKKNVINNAWARRDISGSLGNIDSLKTKIHAGDWNTCRIVAKGNVLQHYINDILMSEVIDEDTVNRKMSGILGVQVHVGPPMTVEYRNILLKEL